jgi:ribonuclease BN (tRNA processing enzyme)
MKIRFLGAHNCETKDTRLVSLLVDDVLAIDAGGLSSSLSFEAQYKIKAVLLTHQHYDHVRDIPMLAMNLFLGGANTTIYSIPEVFDVLVKNLMDEVIYPTSPPSASASSSRIKRRRFRVTTCWRSP